MVNDICIIRPIVCTTFLRPPQKSLIQSEFRNSISDFYRVLFRSTYTYSARVMKICLSLIISLSKIEHFRGDKQPEFNIR